MANIPGDQIQNARSLLDAAKSVAIVIPANPNLDAVASALSLYLSLSSTGKQVAIACPTSMTVEFSHLVGVDKVSNSISGGEGRNLVISFPYQEGSIEKVSYNIDNDTFNLVIEPRESYLIITPDVVRYSYSGGSIDAIITVNVARFADLQGLYEANQGVFTEKPILAIDTHADNERFGKANLTDANVSSVSELVVGVMSQLGLQFDGDIASNLLAGIADGSQNYTSPMTTAATFEAAAICLRNGGMRPAVQMQPASQPAIPYPRPAAPQQYQPPMPQQNYAQTQQPYKPPMNMPPRPPMQPPLRQPQSPRMPAPQPLRQPQPPMSQQHAAPAPQPPLRQPQPPMPQQHAAPAPQPPLRQPQPPMPQQHAAPAPQPPLRQPQPPMPQQHTAPAPHAPAHDAHGSQDDTHAASHQQQQPETPSDWLKPKIYKGTSLV